jgi:outer membrane translocation and assembly module TamA
LRTDLFSAVPSLEYQWPLTHNVGGHLFLDYLLVADSVKHLSFADAPYAYGAGISIQGFRSEVGRIAVSTGSEGWRLMIDVGLTSHVSDRNHWL